MSFFIIFILLLCIDFYWILKTDTKFGNTVLLLDDRSIDKAEKKNLKKIINSGIPVYYISRRKSRDVMGVALKKGIMKRGDSIVTGRETALVSKEELYKLISFCRIYSLCTASEELKKILYEKYDVRTAENIEYKKLTSVNFRKCVFDFLFLTQIALFTAAFTHMVIYRFFI